MQFQVIVSVLALCLLSSFTLTLPMERPMGNRSSIPPPKATSLNELGRGGGSPPVDSASTKKPAASSEPALSASSEPAVSAPKRKDSRRLAFVAQAKDLHKQMLNSASSEELTPEWQRKAAMAKIKECIIFLEGHRVGGPAFYEDFAEMDTNPLLEKLKMAQPDKVQGILDDELKDIMPKGLRFGMAKEKRLKLMFDAVMGWIHHTIKSQGLYLPESVQKALVDAVQSNVEDASTSSSAADNSRRNVKNAIASADYDEELKAFHRDLYLHFRRSVINVNGSDKTWTNVVDMIFGLKDDEASSPLFKKAARLLLQDVPEFYW